MNKFKYIFLTVIAVGVFLFGRRCGVDSVKIPVYTQDTITLTDTIYPDTTKIEVPKPYYVKGDTVLLEIPVPVPIDTFALKMFFAKRFYKNNYKDSNGVYTVEDTVLGYLLHQRLYYRDFKPTIINNSTITPVPVLDTLKTAKKWEIRGGIDATPSNVYLGLDYQRDRLSYSAGYDLFNKQTKIGIKYTIFRNKQ
jgi:hypothetical protein